MDRTSEREDNVVDLADTLRAEKIHELEQYRSLGATGKKNDQLIEERDVVGADIAV